MKVATWNVNGIRARFEDVTAWSEAEAPDVFCLQEIKAAPSQVPEPLTGLPRYHNHWHGGAGGYSGVSLHLRRDTVGAGTIEVPDFEASLHNRLRQLEDRDLIYLDEDHVSEFGRAELIALLEGAGLRVVASSLRLGVQRYWCEVDGGPQ